MLLGKCNLRARSSRRDNATLTAGISHEHMVLSSHRFRHVMLLASPGKYIKLN